MLNEIDSVIITILLLTDTYSNVVLCWLKAHCLTWGHGPAHILIQCMGGARNSALLMIPK